MLKVKSMIELEKLAGIAMPPDYRDMSAYNGKEFECVCGKIHCFNETLNDRNYVARGANATMIVCCPNNYNSKTIITTKYKFLLYFKDLNPLQDIKKLDINKKKMYVSGAILSYILGLIV